METHELEGGDKDLFCFGGSYQTRLDIAICIICGVTLTLRHLMICLFIIDYGNKKLKFITYNDQY